MSNNNLVPAILSVYSKNIVNGIYYIGQYGTSGYASAAKGYLYHYFSNGIPITWEPLYFDTSKLNDDNIYDIVVNSLINKPISKYGMVIMHTTPDLWQKFWQQKPKMFQNKIINGYCTWETSKLPKNWVDYMMKEYIHEIWCPSTYNERIFKESGVTKQIRVVPHIFLPQTLPSQDTVKIISTVNGDRIDKDNRFTFYSIGEMNIRKGINDIIKSFCQAFTNNDPVRLILKVHYRGYTEENIKKCEDMISTELKKYSSYAPIICLFSNMSNKEMLALHSIGDCYISLTKSEGFGLTIFDAINYNKKVIVTGYGGHLDFLGKSYPGLVNYKIGYVTGMSSFSPNYTEEQSWAYPDLDHAIELMREIVNKQCQLHRG